MKAIIDSGRKYDHRPYDKWWNLHYAGKPNYVLSACLGISGWAVSACPTNGGSYAGGGITHNLSEALVPAIRFLIEHGESKDYIVSSIFAEERAGLAEALFGWL